MLNDWEQSGEREKKAQPLRPAENWQEFQTLSLTHMYTEEQVSTTICTYQAIYHYQGSPLNRLMSTGNTSSQIHIIRNPSKECRAFINNICLLFCLISVATIGSQIPIHRYATHD